MNSRLALVQVQSGANWLTLNSVVDETLHTGSANIDDTRRGAEVKTALPDTPEIRIDLRCIWDPSDQALMALYNAQINGSTVVVRTLDQTNGYGLQMTAGVYDWQHQRNRGSAQEVTFSLRPVAGTTITPLAPA